MTYYQGEQQPPLESVVVQQPCQQPVMMQQPYPQPVMVQQPCQQQMVATAPVQTLQPVVQVVGTQFIEDDDPSTIQVLACISLFIGLVGWIYMCISGMSSSSFEFPA